MIPRREFLLATILSGFGLFWRGRKAKPEVKDHLVHGQGVVRPAPRPRPPTVEEWRWRCEFKPTKPVEEEIAAERMRWVQIVGDPNTWYLFEDGRQVGGWRREGDGGYWRGCDATADLWGPQEECIPKRYAQAPPMTAIGRMIQASC